MKEEFERIRSTFNTNVQTTILTQGQ
jgi:hypothetical protein